MTTARRDIVIPGAEGIYHCTSRCVRRAYLCGKDKLTGKDYSHRKAWVRDRLKFLATIFTIEILAFALMDNHEHVLARLLPSLLKLLTEEEVARRWFMLYPPPSGTTPETLELEIKLLLGDRERMIELRERLGSLSWFMKSLNENIAVRANLEDECTGRFWSGRFKAQRIKDEAGVLSCAMYIDLNPIRAKIAETPEDSLFTSAWERIQAMAAKAKVTELQKSASASDAESVLANLKKLSAMDEWLTPIQSTEARRGFLSISLPEYLSLLDWTGRQIRQGKRGSIPGELAPILDRLQINSDRWLDSVQNYGSLFFDFVGYADSFTAAAKALGRCWFKGISAARKVFRVKAQAGPVASH